MNPERLIATVLETGASEEEALAFMALTVRTAGVTLDRPRRRRCSCGSAR